MGVRQASVRLSGLLLRPYCLTVVTRSRAGFLLPRHQYASVASGSQQEDLIPGVNDCPKDCLCSRQLEFSYKNPRFLSQFISSQTGMILPRTITKICMKKQRKLAKTIKRARQMGFMPYTHKQEEYLSDQKLF